MTTLYYQSCRLCQTHYQLHLLVPTPQHLRTLTLMIFPGDLKSWKRKPRSLTPGNLRALGFETQLFLLVTKNLHEILFHLLTITEHTLPLGSLHALNSAAFQFSLAPKRLMIRDYEARAADSGQLGLSVSECEPRFSHHLSFCPSIGEWEGESIVRRAAKDGWTRRRILHEVS